MNKLYLLFVLVLVAALSSCGVLRVEKRHYRNGFYVDFNNNQHKSESADHPSAAAEEPMIADVNPAPVNGANESPKAVETKDAHTPEQHAAQPAKVSDPSPAQPEAVSVNVPSVDRPASRDEAKETRAPAGAADSDVLLIVLVILAIIIPPLAVYLKEGLTGRFWLTLILAILGGGFFFYPVIGGLYLVAIILALLIVLDIM